MLKTVYFDAHHRHKWQCFRIRLVDKMSNKDKVLRLIDFLQAVVLAFMKIYGKDGRVIAVSYDEVEKEILTS